MQGKLIELEKHQFPRSILLRTVASVSQSVRQSANPIQSSPVQSVSQSALAGNRLALSPFTKPEGVLNKGLFG